MLNVNVINAKSTQKVEAKPGQPTHLKVDANTRLELVDSASGKAPTQIKARRVGDNLEIVTDEKAQIEDTTVSNAQAPDLVLEDYFKQADVSLYAGTGQEAMSYVPVDGAASSSYAAMFTSATTGAALAAAPLLSPWMSVAAGAGVAAAAGGGGGGAPVANQGPVAKDDTKSVTENGRLEGAVPNATDADGTVASYRLVGDVASGKLTFNADGSYSFDANKDFDNLAIGQTKTVNFTYSAVDNAGGVSAPKTVTITVTGTNDAPVASAATKSVDEGMKVEGSVTATDADTGATLKYALVGAAPAGLTFKDDGTYSFDAGDAAYDSLKAGETKDVVVKFKANDGVVDSAEQTLTITLKGAAEISGTITGVVTEDVATNTASGTLTVRDSDQAKVAAQKDSAGTYGKFSITEAGVWSYSLDNSNANVQALNADQEVYETFKVKSADGTASEDVTVKITGANDAPVATFVTPIEISEDAGVHKIQLTSTDADAAARLKYKLVDPPALAAVGITLSESGQLSVDTSNIKYQELNKLDLTDLEIKYQVEDDKGSSSLESAFRLKVSGANDTATFSGTATGAVTEDEASANKAMGTLTVSDVDAGQALFQVPTSLAGTYGTYTFNTSSGAWAYTLDNTKGTVQALTAGQNVVDQLVVQSLDGTASQSIAVTVTGANDSATISGTATGAVTEDEAIANKATGTLTVSDVDAGQALFQVPASLAGTYGIYTFNTSSGAWAYTLDNTKGTVQALTAGQNVVDQLVVQSLDGTASQSIDVTITGTNDAPVIQVIDSDSDQVVLTESDQILSASGTLTVTDPDKNDSIVSSEVIDVQLDPAVQSFLTAEQFASVQPALKSLLTLSAAGTMADPHNLKWTFDSAADNNLDLIPKDSALSLKYTIEVKDTAGTTTSHVVTVKIDGTNDAPAIEVELDGTDHANLIETSSALKAQGTVSLLDMDMTDVVSYEVSDVALKIIPSFLSADDFDIIKEQVKGFMTLKATDYLNVANNLQWTFDSTGDRYAGFIPGGQTLSLDYTVTATDKSGQTATHVITIDILGTNATPRIEFKGGSDSAAESLIEADDFLSTTGTMSLTDLDLNDPANATRTSVKVTGFDGGFDNDHFLGMLKLSTETYENGDPLRVNEPHNVRWEFDSVATDDFDYLAKDEILNLEYTIEVKDSLGATSQEVVAVSITGTNDAPKVFMWVGGSASGSILDLTQDVTGSFTIFDEDVLKSDFAEVKFDGVSITDAELKSVLYSLLVTDESSTFETVNEVNNFDWRFETADAFEKGLATGLSSGQHELIYTMNFIDIHNAVTPQDIKISFIV